ncbi:hypothetical protein CS063_08535 [Sporanaerobium hydrogeniformans]|uniref:Uncharacterized protein n=1 Tax=Sporanaerobium hydrogeniformans TaxID=3072179 RepID=A0AC61DD06_9FIRM|nr:hypothetical protein [Sporanaerobium hydrogeniformans]PHV70805.1 hypothetical protein CS063_08535 [Sporanaerobium hydrogeniformans]
MRFLVVDFKRSLQERNFIFSLVLGILLIVVSFSYYFYGHTSYDSWQAFKISQSYLLPFLAPLLASLPYSNMNMLEKDYGYDTFLLNKANTRSYVFRRGLVNAVAGGLVLLLPLLLLGGLCRLLGPYEEKINLVQIFILDFLFGVSFASFAYILTFVNTKRYIPLVAPEVMYLLMTYAFPYLGLETYYPPLCFSPWLLEENVNRIAIKEMISVLVGVAMLSVLLVAIFESLRRRRK